MIKEITIPKSVKTIQARAFAECDNLSNIYFDGTIEEWNTIDKKDDWDKSFFNSEWAICNVTIHCSDGQIIHSAE